MKSAINKEIVRRYQKAWEQADLTTLAELLSEDFVNHSPPLPPTRDEMLEFTAEHRRQFTTGTYTIHAMATDGDQVFVFGHYHGVHDGEPFDAIPASGAEVDFDYFTLLRLADGKIVERWGAADDVLGMLVPLGYTLSPPGE